jgi:hypothetical protein
MGSVARSARRFKHSLPLEETFSLSHWKLPFWVPPGDNCGRIFVPIKGELATPGVSSLTLKLAWSVQDLDVKTTVAGLFRATYFCARARFASTIVRWRSKMTGNAGPSLQLSIR